MFKAVIRNLGKSSKDTEPIYIRVSWRRKTRYIKTNMRVHSVNWDFTNNCVSGKHPNAKVMNIQIQQIILGYEKKILETNVSGMDAGSLVEYLKSDTELNNIFDFYREEFRPTIRADRTLFLYDNTINKLKDYLKKEYCDFKNIDYRFLSQFEKYLRVLGNTTNTIAIEFRNIRAIFNRAISHRIVTYDHYPFSSYAIRIEKTPKRNLSIEQIRNIKNYTGNKYIEYASKVFILIFYMRGINAIDLYNLSKKNIVGDYIRYVRRKTGKELYIKIEPEIKELMEKLKGKDKMFYFQERYANHENFYRNINKQLHKKMPHLTTYWARHSWATVAAGQGIAKDIIAYGLSHGKDTVTDVYIEPSQELVNEAAKMVISVL